MCGIVGIVNEAIDKEQFLKKALKSLEYRGPDDFGIYFDNMIGLGHQRLAIQDLTSNGHNPMFTLDKEYCIIFNGEIYNHWEIREEIKDKYIFKSSSDTETILYGYVEYGTEIFKRLNGIFSVAIYNLKSQKLIIARDQFGIKPLYYYIKDNCFSFASEIKALTTLEGFNMELCNEALLNYVTYLYSPGELTMFKSVKKLLPGHYITMENSVLEIHKYYDIPFEGDYSIKSERDLIDELDNLLLKAVERQLLSDVPIGFFLSGGLDSSAIVAMAKKLRPNEKLNCYTIDTKTDDEGFANDLYYAKIVAKHLDVDLNIVSADINILEDFDKMIYHLDEPQADAAPLNILNICRVAKKNGHKVLLGGSGGDDVFSGYRRHQALYYEKYFYLIPSLLLNASKFLFQKLNSKNPFVRRVRKLLLDIDKPSLERIINYFSWTPLNVAKKLLSINTRSSLVNYKPSSIFNNGLGNIPKEHDDLNRMLYLEMKYFLCDHNLNYTDKLGMAESIEIRVPFLDKELVEFSTRIPPKLKMKGKTTKYLLKKVMERYLPHEIIYRPKTGFGAPIRKWITNDLDDMINDYLSQDCLKKRDLFNYLEVNKLIEENKQGKVDASYTILSLLAVESWMRQFVDTKL